MTAKSDKWITRKLEGICQSLTLPENQGKVVEFLANSKNVQRINGLVEDIHEALMDYQVCISTTHFLLYLTFMLDFTATRYLQ